ncbi:gliding motility protein GldM [Flavobacterium agricola]|uniref:Gliding motility protein GldM n=1 Tax=Flavobacterium agricola TaxID=2870839 RepID=A0ABY6LWG2_9FLAO|nr:gliding motility protein GldM [Flavobacterium agricola]UYW00596.1 gliding motility protein GldM [Flavobacterium agricola]
MASGKQTPRQKMINLMYLVFIAMMALNMSKEVLSAFGLMNEKFEAANTTATANNKNLFAALAAKADENPAQYKIPYDKAKEIKAVSDKFYTELEATKTLILDSNGIVPENGKLPYETMDKGAGLDETWFSGDGYSEKGQAFINAIEAYKAGMRKAIGDDKKLATVLQEVDSKFDISDVKDGEGITKKYLDYHYKGFPSIASLTKISAMENDVRKIEQDAFSAFMGNTAAAAASMTNYQAIVIMDKSAFFAGEPVTGRVVLGRYDESTVPTSVVVNGNKVKIDKGEAIFKFAAGNVGDHKIGGQFTFMEDGKAINIPINGNYVVVPKPNSANISADKMNTVYRGVQNPMTISFAGVSNDKVTASAPGLSKSGNGYVWDVTTIQGNQATVNVTAVLPDGTKVTDQKTFNVRGIPAPVAKVRGSVNSAKGSKADLANSPVQVAFPDFVYDVNTKVTGFELFVPGQPAIVVNGDRMTDQAKKAIATAQKGDKITINNVKTTLDGAPGYRMPGSSPFIWEVN